MDVKRQQGSVDQGDLLDEALKAALRHGANGEGGTGPGAAEEPQASAAWDHERALTRQLMEEQAEQAMPLAWFDALGLNRMADHHAALKLVGNRRGT
jgi:hypothetical protein